MTQSSADTTRRALEGYQGLTKTLTLGIKTYTAAIISIEIQPDMACISSEGEVFDIMLKFKVVAELSEVV